MEHLSCRKCGRYISNQASTCPVCKEPINKSSSAVKINGQNISSDTIFTIQKEHHRRSWIKKLWYGEYPLTTVLWVFGCVVNAPFSGLASALAAVLLRSQISFSIRMTITCILSIITSTYNIIVAVGAWRSTKEYLSPETTKNSFKMLILLLVYLACFVFLANCTIVAELLHSFDFY